MSISELIQLRQAIEAIKRRTVNDLDAMAAQVDLLLPKDNQRRSDSFRRYTRADWDRFIDDAK